MIRAAWQRARDEWRANRRLRVAGMAALAFLGLHLLLAMGDQRGVLAERYGRDVELQARFAGMQEQKDWPERADQAEAGLQDMRARIPAVTGAGLAQAEMQAWLTELAARTGLVEPKVNFRDAFREVINVAMGRAAALLARVLGVFVELPVPNVNILEVSELHMALADAQSDDRLTAICQGYIGGGIAGEALLIFHDSEVTDMAKLLRRSASENSAMEMLLDMSSVVIGACLSGIAEQINIKFSQGHPQVLGQHSSIDELIRLNQQRWRKTLAV